MGKRRLRPTAGSLEPWATPGSFPQVSRHLSKLFDSLCKLKFRLDAEGKPLKFGLGMYSKEDEFVDFDEECDLSGQVSLPVKRGGGGQAVHCAFLSSTAQGNAWVAGGGGLFYSDL